MKKNFGRLAAIPLLAMLATSCGQEVVETKDSNVISYGIATGKQTLSRATEVIVDDLYGGFDVSAIYTGTGTAFGNFTVSYSGGAWGYGTEVYHPTDGLSHYTVVGTETGFAAGGTSATFGYTAVGQEDLIAAATTTTAANATANLTFKHLLSQVNFAVNGLEDTNIAITISDISLSNLENAGTYTLGNGNEGTWALAGTNTGAYTSALTAQSDPTATYTFMGSSLMLMPQAFTEDFTDGGFSFTYTLKDGDVTIGNGTVNMPFGDAAFAQYTQTWEPGTRYLYVITFETPNKLKYNVVEVKGWEDPNLIPVDVDTVPGA